jgi:hypothetical protein
MIAFVDSRNADFRSVSFSPLVVFFFADAAPSRRRFPPSPSLPIAHHFLQSTFFFSDFAVEDVLSSVLVLHKRAHAQNALVLLRGGVEKAEKTHT